MCVKKPFLKTRVIKDHFKMSLGPLVLYKEILILSLVSKEILIGKAIIH